MIRKSVETRDWLNTIEPRNVRAVMKRLVEDVTATDTQVGQLYEEGVRKAHSSGLLLYFRLHYITFYYIALHYITLYYITLHYIAVLQNTNLRIDTISVITASDFMRQK